MITYSFKVTNINRLLIYIDEENNSYENVITKINYYYEGIDSDDNTKAIYNSCINLSRPTSITIYTKYSDLKEDNLIEWITQLISNDELELMQTVIKNNILNQQTKGTLPWLT